MHGRLSPIKRVFRYPIYFYAFDLSEFEEIETKLGWIFGYNKRRLISVWDKDYLKGHGSILEKIKAKLSEQNIHKDVSRIELITSARFFNYVFNPVSFYYCYGSDDLLKAVVAEVNNTFGERHLYILKNLTNTSGDRFVSELLPKQFHVSPFNDMEGDYDFHFSKDTQTKIDIRLNILREGEKAFLSSQTGAALPLTRANLLKVFLRFPLTAALTMPRILFQAGLLHYVKRLKVFRKPVLNHDESFQVKRPSIVERIAQRLIYKYFSKFSLGHLRILDPRGEWREFGSRDSNYSAVIRVKDFRFFTRALFQGDVGLGESFTCGEWKTDNLVNLLRLFIANRNDFDDRSIVWASIGKFINRMSHLLLRRNTRRGSLKNIQFHYDLSNDFFGLILDSSMTYSCAYFTSPEESLEQGQRNKIQRIIKKARLKKEDYLLEIGSGWGEVAITAAKQIGCRVTTLTLSEQQFEWVTKRIQNEGLGHLVEVKLCDYRDLMGQFDKIISVEMLEAIGEKELPKFFRQCQLLLKPFGIMVIQVISIPDRRFESYKYDSDWIQKHIFPGSLCPSLNAILKAQTAASDFFVEDLENIGSHYARTLREWHHRLDASTDKIKHLGFDDEFLRAWDYYLSYCEAGFAERFINDLQIVFTRPRNQSLNDKSSVRESTSQT